MSGRDARFRPLSGRQGLAVFVVYVAGFALTCWLFFPGYVSWLIRNDNSAQLDLVFAGIAGPLIPYLFAVQGLRWAVDRLRVRRAARHQDAIDIEVDTGGRRGRAPT